MYKQFFDEQLDTIIDYHPYFRDKMNRFLLVFNQIDGLAFDYNIDLICRRFDLFK